jgi:hypothetical protein
MFSYPSSKHDMQHDIQLLKLQSKNIHGYSVLTGWYWLDFPTIATCQDQYWPPITSRSSQRSSTYHEQNNNYQTKTKNTLEHMTCRTNLLPHSPKSLMVSRSTRLGISRIPERYNQCTRAWPPRISGRCYTTLEKNSWRFYFRSYFTTYIVLSYSNILIGINILHMTNYSI